MPLVSASRILSQLPSGQYDYRNPRAKLRLEVTWNWLAAPSFADVIVNTWSFDFSTILNLPAGATATYTLEPVGSTPSGMAINSSSGVAAQTNTTPGVFTGRVIATVSGIPFASPIFTQAFIEAPVEAGDTEAPGYSGNITATVVEVAGVQKVDVAVLLPNDTAADDETPTGLASWTLLRDGTPIASDMAITDPGESVRLTGQNIGGGTGGSTVRAGHDYTVTALGTGFGGTGGEIGHRAYALVSRDTLDYTTLFRSLTGDVVSGSPMWLRLSEDSDGGAPVMTMGYWNAAGARIRGRAIAGQSSSAGSLNATFTLPMHMRVKYLGSDVYEWFGSPGDTKPTADTWQSLGTRTVSLPATLRIDQGASAVGNGTTHTVVAEFENLSGSSLPYVTYRDESPVPSSSEVYTATFEDGDGNVSAVSGAITVAIPANTADVTPPTAPVVTLTNGQNQIAFNITTQSTDASGVAGYVVRYGTTSPPATIWNNTDTAPHTSLSGVITGLSNSTVYYVTLQPIDNAANAGTQTATTPASVTTLGAPPVADTRRPPAPTLTVSQIAGNPTTLRLERTEGANPDDIAITHTKIFYGTTDTASGSEWPLTAISGTPTVIDVTGLSNANSYWFRARDYNADGDPEQYSAASAIVGPATPVSVGTPVGLIMQRRPSDSPIVVPPGGLGATGPILEQGSVPTGWRALTRGAQNLQVSNRQARHPGTYSYRAYTWGESSVAQDRERCEFRAVFDNNQTDSGGITGSNRVSERYEGFSVYLPAARWGTQHRDEHIQQFHVNPDPGATHKNPAGTISMRGTVKATGAIPAGHFFASRKNDISGSASLSLGILPKDVWIDFVWHILWTRASNGFMRLYSRYNKTGPLVQRLNWTNIVTIYPDEYGPYHKMGNYNPDWPITAPPVPTGNPVTNREAFYGAYRIADGTGSLAVVDPANYTA
jgi:hypothetical protein